MSDNPVFDQIESEIKANDVVLFMKGTPVFPQCGFSAAVVQALSNLGIKFKGVDVLADMNVREGIKRFSNWPTIPQLYVKGEFVGGCDIVREMYATGELVELFEKAGVEVKLANPT
jgi:monothiol glutaredoxin